MKATKSLLVLWQDKESTLYFHVGTLSYDGKKYMFEYTHHSNSLRNVHNALENGYRPHPAFPELEKKYESDNLFPAFNRRIPSSDRVDYIEILNNLQLPMDADRMDILRKTRGMLSGDHYSFEEPLRLNNKNNLQSHFYISGMRHQKLPANWSSKVYPNSKLTVVPEHDNKHDPYAVKIKTEDGQMLGYIPGVYAQAVKALIARGIDVKLTVSETQPTYAPQWWVRVHLCASLSTGKDQMNVPIVKELEDLIFQVA